MGELDGKVALVTGASGGLGSAVTPRLLQAGAKVGGTYLHEAEMARLRTDLASAGLDDADFFPIEADVTCEGPASAAVEAVVSRWGRLDILLNLVGGYMPPVNIADLSLADWERQFTLNLTSAFLCSRAAIPAMVAQGWGRIVNISSKRALEPGTGAGPYACSKLALIGLTQTLSEELKDKGITANAILPSVIDSPAMRAARPKADPAKWVTGDQIADLILYLCSDAAGALTGAAIPLYGRA